MDKDQQYSVEEAAAERKSDESPADKEFSAIFYELLAEQRY